MYNWEQISPILDRVLDLNPDERSAFIEEICGDEPALKENIIRFLEGIEPSEKLWDKMVQSGSILVNEITGSNVNIDTSKFYSPLKQAGPYKIIELIASGGMGDVYFAERSDGQFKRKVAIKILRHELNSKNHAERFSAERNILSGLEHPNIARLYDGGVTEDSRPYLIMEFVDGTPITSYCRKNSCSLKEILDLFKQVCKAVEYAHRNLVVHRDLKPDNILVKTDGTVKVLDFGIAKILNDDLTPEKPGETRENLHMLSIQYATPEQITFKKITTATDVYALGLLLYEMITCLPPFNLKDKTLKEAEQIICFEEPEKPSRFISESGKSKKVKGDLDTIIMKALCKEPELRYFTVDHLVEDIENWKMHLPVHARERSVPYQLSKFIRRNRGLLFALAIAGTLASGFIAYHLSEVQKQKEIALAGQQQAEFVTGYLTDLFQSASPGANQGDTLSVFDLLDIGKMGLLTLDDDFIAKPNLLSAFANSYLNLGNYDEAISFYEQAYGIIRSTYGASEQLADGAIRLGNAHSVNRNFDTAILYYEEALDLINNLDGDFSDLKARFLGRYARAVTEVGDTERSFQILEEARGLYTELNQHSSAVKNIKMTVAHAYRNNEQYEESEKLYHEILKDYEQESDVHRIYNDLAYLLVVQERPAEAIEYYLKSLASLRTVYSEDHPSTLLVMNNLAAAYSDNEQFEKTESLLLQRIPLIKQRYGEFHWRVGSANEGLGVFYLSTGKFEDAEELFSETYSLYSEVLGPAHSWTAVTMVYLAYCKALNGLTEESNILFRESYTTLKNNRAVFDYFEKTKIEKLLTNLNNHPSDMWRDELALLEEINK